MEYDDLYRKFLELSKSSKSNLYYVLSLDGLSHKLGISKEGFPMFFVRTENSVGVIKNGIRENLSVEYCVECEVVENDGNRIKDVYSIITLRALDKHLQIYFIEIFLMMLKKLPFEPSRRELSIEIEKIISIFSSLKNPPRKKIQGLWAELLVIENSKSPESLINAWHTVSSSKYDFTMGSDKVEVKSTSSENRVHKFSLDQLNPSPNSRLLIASTVVRESGKCASGLSVKGLFDKIAEKVSSLEAKMQVYKVIAETIGSDIVKWDDMYFDYVTATDTLVFFDYQDVPKLHKKDIPKDVTEIKFCSNLSNVKDIKTQNIISNYTNSPLFNCLF